MTIKVSRRINSPPRVTPTPIPIRAEDERPPDILVESPAELLIAADPLDEEVLAVEAVVVMNDVRVAGDVVGKLIEDVEVSILLDVELVKAAEAAGPCVLVDAATVPTVINPYSVAMKTSIEYMLCRKDWTELGKLEI